jgi:hypothetical protein
MREDAETHNEMHAMVKRARTASEKAKVSDFHLFQHDKPDCNGTKPPIPDHECKSARLPGTSVLSESGSSNQCDDGTTDDTRQGINEDSPSAAGRPGKRKEVIMSRTSHVH